MHYEVLLGTARQLVDAGQPARELQAVVREPLSAHEYPRAVAFAEELPLT